MKKVAILQSNYIPWKGYFDIIASVDEFILYDDMQFTRRDWRNRNKIKIANGTQWLTIPVEVKGKFDQKICETKISDKGWVKEHLNSIHHAYAKAPFYSELKEWLSNLYWEAESEDFLSIVNYKFIRAINSLLDIKTPIKWSMDFQAKGEKSERLLDICIKTGATVYLSGPAAKSYLDEKLFSDNDIRVEWMNYSWYPFYNQLFPPFEHGVTILDLILNVGKNAPDYFLMDKMN